jgi:peptidoglycan/LPS O-acetylase OafA/YrhL
MSIWFADAAVTKSRTPSLTVKSRRYQTLDLWRGIACLMVVVHHGLIPLCDLGLPTENPTSKILWVANSNDSSALTQKPANLTLRSEWLNRLNGSLKVSVSMFFVVSGYCITASAESLRRSNRSVGSFFYSRFLRVYPAFWCALLLSALACCAFDSVSPGILGQSPWPLAMPQDLSRFQWLGNLTLTGTWIGYLTGESSNCFPLQSWTLAYEIQFYTLTGVVLACFRRKFFHIMAMVTMLVAILDACVLIYDFPIKGFLFDEYWFMFAAGIGLYWELHCASPQQARIFRTFTLGVISGLTLLAGTTTIFGAGTHFSAWRVLGAFGFAILLRILNQYDEILAGWKPLSGIKSCGVMCYSIYLVHLFPGKVISQYFLRAGFTDDFSALFLLTPCILLASITLGYLFHLTIECRFFQVLPETVKMSQTTNPKPPQLSENQQESRDKTFLQEEVRTQIAAAQGQPIAGSERKVA